MGYLNNQVGYTKDILTSRSFIKYGNCALLEPNGLVKNVIPGFENCDITIMGSPKMGASFVDYLVTMQPNGKNTKGFGGGEVETFVFVIEGKIKAAADKDAHTLEKGGYLYCPAGVKMYLENDNGTNASKLFLYKRKYVPVEGYSARVVVNNIKNIEEIEYEGMSNVIIQSFLPAELGFDMNIHILNFKMGGSHGYIETHVQEHGALILSGKGMYNLDNQWLPVKEGDYLFMGSYSCQVAYAVGEEDFSYIYSKDCHRDIEL